MTTRRILRIRETESRVGLKKSAIYDLVSKSKFPEPVPLGQRAHGWLEDELAEWIEAQAAKRSPKRWSPEKAAA